MAHTNTTIRHTGLIAPEGCRWCGWIFKDHGTSYCRGKGFHQWQAPTDAQIKARIAAKYKTDRQAQ